jgi:uroporphyrin-III C-methyltransferase/precorrin-2 dehydrogenase/sirohydrochlorin ferrochelatase
MKTARGRVALVGAGPGAPDLLTLRASARLRTADVVFYDGLTTRQALALAPSAEHVSVARRVGRKTLGQAQVIAMMIEAAREGRQVVRLKSGDPFVLGRGGEEARALRAAHVPVEVVPGITTALAAPALAGIAVTERGVSAALVIISGHDAASYMPVLGRLEPGSATLVVLMGLAERAGVRRCLVDAGWSTATPAAIVIQASRTGERVWVGTLGTLGTRVDGVRGRTEPGVIVIGEVVERRTPLDTGADEEGEASES